MFKPYMYLLLLLSCPAIACAQDKGGVKENPAEALLAAAMGPVGRDDDFAISFERIVIGLKKPEDALLSTTKSIYKGGHFYYDKGAYEVNIGSMKMLCNGAVHVTIDENTQQMVIDSVPHQLDSTEREKDKEQLIKMVGIDITDGIIENTGEVSWSGHKCYKIKLSHKNEKGIFSFFWIDVKSHKLYAMADYQLGLYDVYLLKKIGSAPKGYSYKVVLPQKEVNKLYGYEVLDLRYSKDLNK